MEHFVLYKAEIPSEMFFFSFQTSCVFLYHRAFDDHVHMYNEFRKYHLNFFYHV